MESGGDAKKAYLGRENFRDEVGRLTAIRTSCQTNLRTATALQKTLGAWCVDGFEKLESVRSSLAQPTGELASLGRVIAAAVLAGTLYGTREPSFKEDLKGSHLFATLKMKVSMADLPKSLQSPYNAENKKAYEPTPAPESGPASASTDTPSSSGPVVPALTPSEPKAVGPSAKKRNFSRAFAPVA